MLAVIMSFFNTSNICGTGIKCSMFNTILSFCYISESVELACNAHCYPFLLQYFQNLWNWIKMFIAILSFCNTFRICGPGIKCLLLSFPYAILSESVNLEYNVYCYPVLLQYFRICDTGIKCLLPSFPFAILSESADLE